MEIVKFDNYSFTYPNEEQAALKKISFSVNAGDFVTVCGKSGCGKSTMLRALKPLIAPTGSSEGEIFFNGKSLSDIEEAEQAAKIGFVFQNPDNQCVTDKVWHELSFGLESLGESTESIKIKVAETASFFGIENLFYEDVANLSGGQKQMLNLASVMVMKPELLILDEPTSRLDPISAEEFVAALVKINRELGTTVILSEHRLNEVLPVSDKVIIMESGSIAAAEAPEKIGPKLKKANNEMLCALPTQIRIFAQTCNDKSCPLSIADGRNRLREVAEERTLKALEEVKCRPAVTADTASALELKHIWFKYESGAEYTITDMSISVHFGEIYSVLGGNGVGKTTMLSIMAGDNEPQRGKVTVCGKKAADGTAKIAFLPQNPQTLFVKKTVEDDLKEIFAFSKASEEEIAKETERVIKLCDLEEVRKRHPYDLSGGEQQRLAFAKILLLKPQIILLDEPTKGTDAIFKRKFAEILKKLKKDGMCIIIVSHDMEFCATVSDRCGLMFNGAIVYEERPEKFFSGNTFYTTAANRMSRGIIPNAISDDDILYALGEKTKQAVTDEIGNSSKPADKSIPHKEAVNKENNTECKKKDFKISRILTSLLFVLTVYFGSNRFNDARECAVQALELLFLGLAINPFLPKHKLGIKPPIEKTVVQSLSKRRIISAAATLLVVSLTVFVGFYLLNDRKYYFISLMIILETIAAFFFTFEKRKPQARELVIISVLCAIAVAGRTVFYMLPQFKPTLAIVIITGVMFGGEAGFLTGAVTGFVSNFFFGQGAWTPWQMFSFGIIGFLAGILFKRGLLKRSKLSLCIFGALSAVLIYGGIMNPASIIMFQGMPAKEMLVSAYVMGLPYDVIHGFSTAFFMWLLAEPFIEKLERIKVKYGLMK